jgi:hypothetical protein
MWANVLSSESAMVQDPSVPYVRATDMSALMQTQRL